jgi:hypothetical protein
MECLADIEDKNDDDFPSLEAIESVLQTNEQKMRQVSCISLQESWVRPNNLTTVTQAVRVNQG